jgi:hypothetical protein
MKPEELEGKFITGILHRKEAPEYTQLYYTLTKSFEKPVDRLNMEGE